MKAKVYVTLKPSVLDPQGSAIKHTLTTLGYTSITDVRQGKYFEVVLADNADAGDVRANVERIARDVLANPVIEDARIEIEGETR